jgi:hypothetical protein
MAWLKRNIMAAQGQGNYFGTGEDGDIRITSTGAEQSFDGGVTWTTIATWILVGSVVSIPSVQDGDMVVVNARSWTVDAGMAPTLANRCRGLLLYCSGNLTNNGDMSLTACGCHANPADAVVTANTPVAPSDGNPVSVDGLVIARFAEGGTDSGSSDLSGCGTAARSSELHQPPVSNGFVLTIPRVAGLGGVAQPTQAAGDTHPTGPGGGGSGGGISTYPDYPGGPGGDATCFSGGPGGSGMSGDSSGQFAGNPGDDYGGAGADAPQDDPTPQAYGGAGNPAGADGPDAATNGGTAEDGTGGLGIAVVNGDILGTGVFSSQGSPGGPILYNGAMDGGGGGSGGGLWALLYSGTLSEDITSGMDGGPGGQFPNYSARNGGDGADGAFLTQKIDPA